MHIVRKYPASGCLAKIVVLGIVALLLWCNKGFGQTGRLVADTLNKKLDTIYFKGIMYWDFSKGATTKIDSGYAIVKTAPMVFIGENNVKARTDQVATLEEKWFILPKRTSIEGRHIISALRKE